MIPGLPFVPHPCNPFCLGREPKARVATGIACTNVGIANGATFPFIIFCAHDFRSPFFFLTNVLLILHPFNMFIIVLFHPYPQKLVRIWITNTFIYKCSCVHDCASSLLCNLGSLTLISIALGCAFVNVYTSMDGCTFSMTFSSLASVYSNCASTNCCSTISSSSNFSMNTRSSKIALGHACSLAHQLFMMLHKNSIADLLVLYIS